MDACTLVAVGVSDGWRRLLIYTSGALSLPSERHFRTWYTRADAVVERPGTTAVKRRLCSSKAITGMASRHDGWSARALRAGGTQHVPHAQGRALPQQSGRPPKPEALHASERHRRCSTAPPRRAALRWLDSSSLCLSAFTFRSPLFHALSLLFVFAVMAWQLPLVRHVRCVHAGRTWG